MKEKITYKPSDASKANEDAVKSPLIEEYNIMGAKFRGKNISLIEWNDFKKEWLKRLKSSMHDVVKNRAYVEDTTIGVTL
ncbi:hypothetical protein KAR91_59205 [Candidatus Pacearchaeota archaeon]|nr:hypothetical protein [Candidatus Pacearchaeota archaeon]